MGKTKNYRLTEDALKKVGIKKAYKLLTFVACWGIFMSKNGRPPASVDEYADWWHVHRATAFRDLEVFRTAYPDHAYPTEICEWLDRQDVRVFQASAPVVALHIGGMLA